MLKGGGQLNLTEHRAGFLWLHFDLVDLRVGRWCESQTTLGDATKKTFLSAGDQLQLDYINGRLCGVFADYAQELTETSRSTAQLHFVLCEQWLITGRRHPLRGAQKVRDRINGGARFLRPANVLEALAMEVFEEIQGTAASLERQLEHVEDRVLVEPICQEVRLLAPIRRDLVRYDRQLAKSGAVLQRFVARLSDLDAPAESIMTTTARLLQRIDSVKHDIQALQERARLLQEEAADHRAAEMNRHLYVLSILTAILMPPTLVVSAFGMNTGGLPFGNSPYGFLAAVGVGALSAGIIIGLLNLMRRRNDW
jgi:zinc transporter